MAEGENRRVLVVDDDASILKIVRTALESSRRWEVDVSAQPEEGFELALKNDYDLLIFDFSMPRLDGALLFHLLAKAYEHARPPRVMPPLLLISGQGSDERAQQLLQETQVRGFLAKPFTVKSLLEKVKSCFPELQPVA